MGLWNRIFKVAESEAHSAVDKLEDPIKMTEQGIRDLRKDLQNSVKSLAEVKALAIRRRREAEENKETAGSYERKAMLLLQKNATVTICHSRTRDLPAIVAQADILVGAVGKPEFIKADWVKDGAVVVDAGYHPGGVGDIELAAVIERARAYTPVPGGVGPMTINTLIMQSVESAEKALLV